MREMSEIYTDGSLLFVFFSLFAVYCLSFAVNCFFLVFVYCWIQREDCRKLVVTLWQGGQRGTECRATTGIRGTRA